MREASTDRLMSDLRAVLEDAEALLSATAGQAGEKIQRARERAPETVKVARERLADTQEEVVKQAKRRRERDRRLRARQSVAGRGHCRWCRVHHRRARQSPLRRWPLGRRLLHTA